MACSEPGGSGQAPDRCQAGVRRHPLAIVIAHYNDPEGLALSLGSISDQEPADVIVIDDGSQRLPVLSDLRGHLNAAHHLDLITLPRNWALPRPGTRACEYASSGSTSSLRSLIAATSVILTDFGCSGDI